MPVKSRDDTKRKISNVDDIIHQYRPDVRPYEEIYKDIHRNPELPCQEKRTAEGAGDHLRALGFDVNDNIGGYGVVGLLDNGSGPTVLLRAKSGALPGL